MVLVSLMLTKKCPNCGREFETYDSQKVCCGTKCKTEYSRKHHQAFLAERKAKREAKLPEVGQSV